MRNSAYSAAIMASLAVMPAHAATVRLTAAANPSPVGTPIAVINDAHQALAVWAQGTQVVARVRGAGPWGAAAVISPPATNASVLDAAEAKSGEAAVLLAITPVTGNAMVEAAFYAAGSWTAPAPIPATAGSRVLNARLRYDGTGTATLVWTEQSAAGCTVMTALGAAATGWQAPQPLGSGCYPFLQLAVNASGEAVIGLGAPSVVRHGGSPWIVASRSLAGTWTTLIILGTGVYATPPAVAIADNGAALAAFSDANLGVQWSRRARVDGSWSAPAILDGTVPAVPVAVAMTAKGRAVAVYNSYYTNVAPAPLLAATLANGSNRWSAPALLTDAASTIDTFAVAATPAGSFAAAWVNSSNAAGGTDIGASIMTAGSASWTSTVLDTDRSGGTSPSPLAASIGAAAGRALVVWNNADAKSFAVDTVLGAVLPMK